MAHVRNVVALLLAFACLAVSAREVAAFNWHPVGNTGANVGFGWRDGIDPPSDVDGVFKSTYPYPLGTGTQEKVEMYVDICCHDCPASCPSDCCVQYTDLVWRVKDKNMVAGPSQSMGPDDSCDPCEECITKMISGVTGPNAGNGYPQGWSYPASSLVFEVKNVRCKCCESGTASVAESRTFTATPMEEE